MNHSGPVSGKNIKDHAIYEGVVTHSRFTPKQHHFDYKVFMVYINLNRLDDFLSRSVFWSKKWWAFAKFKRSDFHGNASNDLDTDLRRTIEKQTGKAFEGEICMLANLRYFGYNMNPLATYYCFKKDSEELEFIVAEVNNTPWDERKAWVLECAGNDAEEFRFDKDFTVSPFNPIDMQYHWRCSRPEEKLDLLIDCLQVEQKITSASLHLKRKEATGAALNSMLWRFPFMTLKVITSIYWQALRLWLKGVPFLGKNKTGAVNKSHEFALRK